MAWDVYGNLPGGAAFGPNRLASGQTPDSYRQIVTPAGYTNLRFVEVSGTPAGSTPQLVTLQRNGESKTLSFTDEQLASGYAGAVLANYAADGWTRPATPLDEIPTEWIVVGGLALLYWLYRR